MPIFLVWNYSDKNRRIVVSVDRFREFSAVERSLLEVSWWEVECLGIGESEGEKCEGRQPIFFILFGEICYHVLCTGFS
jgi:hypothetical protein